MLTITVTKIESGSFRCHESMAAVQLNSLVMLHLYRFRFPKNIPGDIPARFDSIFVFVCSGNAESLEFIGIEWSGKREK